MRKCEDCKHGIDSHYTAPEGFARPCNECRCLCFTDDLHRQACSRARRTSTVWDTRESVVVFEKPDGTFSFPARNDKPTPPGWHRHEARTDRELARLERLTGTRNERRWYDSNGRGFDDNLAPVPKVN